MNLQTLKNSRHFMLDIETLGTEDTSAVWEVGLLAFRWQSPFSTHVTGAHVHHLITSTQVGRTKSEATLQWMVDRPHIWDRYQSSQLHGSSNALTSPQLFDRLASVIGPDGYVWCKGASFDFAIMKNLFGGRTPWHYRNECCARSIYNMATLLGYEAPKLAPLHEALSDAQQQIDMLEAALRFIFHSDVVNADAKVPFPAGSFGQR